MKFFVSNWKPNLYLEPRNLRAVTHKKFTSLTPGGLFQLLIILIAITVVDKGEAKAISKRQSTLHLINLQDIIDAVQEASGSKFCCECEDCFGKNYKCLRWCSANDAGGQ